MVNDYRLNDISTLNTNLWNSTETVNEIEDGVDTNRALGEVKSIPMVRLLDLPRINLVY